MGTPARTEQQAPERERDALLPAGARRQPSRPAASKNTVYTGRVLDELRAAGELITTSELEHISPLAHQHIHLYGHYPFDLATRPDGHRPLRTPAVPAVATAVPTPQTPEPRLT